MKKLLLLLVMLCLCTFALADEEIHIEDTITINGETSDGFIVDDVILTEDGDEILLDEDDDPVLDPIARNDFIDRIIALGEELYIEADGRTILVISMSARISPPISSVRIAMISAWRNIRPCSW